MLFAERSAESPTHFSNTLISNEGGAAVSPVGGFNNKSAAPRKGVLGVLDSSMRALQLPTPSTFTNEKQTRVKLNLCTPP